MAFDPFAIYRAGVDREREIDTRRSEKAKAFREYVDAKSAAGEEVDPYELDRVRMSMAGGDPYLASYIPAGDALNNMASRANEQSKLNRMKIANDITGQRQTEREYVQKIVDDNWDKTPEELTDVFTNTFGQDGIRIYDQFKPELDSMLSESTGKKYANLAQNPASKLIRSEDDLYRFYPAEMRNSKTAAVLRTMAKDNMRSRNMEDFNSTIDVMGKTPSFVPNSPEMQNWWENFGARGLGYDSAANMPDRGQQFRTGMQGAYTQIQQTQHAKLSELAAKDPYFLNAAQSGDEESIFASIRSLMVQAGMPAPQTSSDPAYIEAKKSLDLISRTNAITTYNKRESDLKAAATEEAEAITKGAKARLQAVQDATFSDKKYGNGKSGKDAAIDERITMALNMVNTDPSFFQSPENIQLLADFIRSEYDRDKDGFDPAAAAGQFMAEASLETRAQWVDRRANSVLETEHQIKPGTNFKVWSDKRSSTLQSIMTSAFEALSAPTETQQEYDALMESKATTVQSLRNELNKIRTVINTVNNDPSQRTNLMNYDYGQAVRSMQTLENSLKAIESYNPVPPVSAQPQQPLPQRGSQRNGYEPYYNNQPDPVNIWGGSNNYKPVSYTNVPQTRLDTYLDTIADVESSGDPFARAKTSSASGLFQFTQGTWDAMVQKYGERYGIVREDIWNPAAQRVMASQLTIDNANQLMTQTGREPDEGDLYLAHFLGPARASTVINNQGSSLLAANLFPDAARANRDIFFKDGVPVTIDQLYKTLRSKVKRNSKQQGTAI